MGYRIAGAVAALLSAVCGVLAFSDPGPGAGPLVAADQSSGTTSEEMAELSAEYPRTPIVLPVEIPDDYGWAGIGRVEGDGDTVWARSSQFSSVAGGPLVEVCVKAVQERRGCEFANEPFFSTRADGVRVFVSSVSGAELTEGDADPWKSTPYTTDYDSVSWIP